MSEIKSFISSKEGEIKAVLLQKISLLENELSTSIQKNKNLQLSLDKLKEAYKVNLKVIEERDNDLKSYEDKFDSISNIIENKENEIQKLKNENENILSKLKYEKDQRTKNEEYNKFVINKQNEKNKEEINELNTINENLKKNNENLGVQLSEKNSQIEQIQKKLEQNENNYIQEKNNFESQINQKNSEIDSKKEEINNLTEKIKKIENNLIQIEKEKLELENKCKQLTMNEQEKINYANLSNQKIKYMQTELDQNKEEIKKLNIKISNYLNQIDKLKDEVYIQKENTSKKKL